MSMQRRNTRRGHHRPQENGSTGSRRWRRSRFRTPLAAVVAVKCLEAFHSPSRWTPANCCNSPFDTTKGSLCVKE